MPTLLEYLSEPNSNLDRSNSIKGPNTFNLDWDEVDAIVDWTDFTYQNLVRDFGDALHTEYSSEDLDWPSRLRGLSSCIVDEESVNAVLLKHNHVILSCALELAPASPNRKALSWALGCHAHHDSMFPDWSGVEFAATHPRENRVPGDTKVSGKWQSEMRYRGENGFDEFCKPLRQVLHYAGEIGTRYGYVISDRELMCIRRRVSEFEGSPLSKNRSRRDRPGIQVTPPRNTSVQQPPNTPSPRAALDPSRITPQAQRIEAGRGMHAQPPKTPSPGRQRQTSISSTMSGISQMSIDSPGNLLSSPSAYTDNSNPVRNQIVEIVCIPWDNSGPDVMTVNLGLFYIHMLAGFDIAVNPSYSPIQRTATESEASNKPPTPESSLG